VPLNELETQLLNKYLDTPDQTAEQVTNLLTKVKSRLSDNRRALKNLNRVLPLFEKHEFWST
jgi:hypothetical protein